MQQLFCTLCWLLLLLSHMKRSATSVSLINKSHVQAPKIKVLVFLISDHQIKTARHSLRRFIIVNCGSPNQRRVPSSLSLRATPRGKILHCFKTRSVTGSVCLCVCRRRGPALVSWRTPGSTCLNLTGYRRPTPSWESRPQAAIVIVTFKRQGFLILASAHFFFGQFK